MQVPRAKQMGADHLYGAPLPFSGWRIRKASGLPVSFWEQ